MYKEDGDMEIITFRIGNIENKMMIPKQMRKMVPIAIF